MATVGRRQKSAARGLCSVHHVKCAVLRCGAHVGKFRDRDPPLAHEHRTLWLGGCTRRRAWTHGAATSRRLKCHSALCHPGVAHMLPRAQARRSPRGARSSRNATRRACLGMGTRAMRAALMAACLHGETAGARRACRSSCSWLRAPGAATSRNPTMPMMTCLPHSHLRSIFPVPHHQACHWTGA